MVAETPLDAQPAHDPSTTAMHTESDPAASIGGHDEQVLEKTESRSYLDSVVGRGTNAALFLVDSINESDEATVQISDTSAGLAGEQTNPIDAQRPLPNPGGHSKGNVAASRARPYGPWMIVTRAERRPPGRPPGPNANRGIMKDTTHVSGSRFAPLNGDDIAEDPVMDDNVRNNDDQAGASRWSQGGDVVMEIEDQQEPGLAEGASSPST
nr:hypothetical protein Iba_chr10dCG9720 [Ipomoea batatas]